MLNLARFLLISICLISTVHASWFKGPVASRGRMQVITRKAPAKDKSEVNKAHFTCYKDHKGRPVPTPRNRASVKGY